MIDQALDETRNFTLETEFELTKNRILIDADKPQEIKRLCINKIKTLLTNPPLHSPTEEEGGVLDTSMVQNYTWIDPSA